MFKCKTSKKEKFHEIASNISREMYVFVKNGVFSGSRKNVRLPRDHCQYSLGTPTLFAINFHYIWLLFITFWL